jgi:hypothetical protein
LSWPHFHSPDDRRGLGLLSRIKIHPSSDKRIGATAGCSREPFKGALGALCGLLNSCLYACVDLGGVLFARPMMLLTERPAARELLLVTESRGQVWHVFLKLTKSFEPPHPLHDFESLSVASPSIRPTSSSPELGLVSMLRRVRARLSAV